MHVLTGFFPRSRSNHVYRTITEGLCQQRSGLRYQGTVLIDCKTVVNLSEESGGLPPPLLPPRNA